MIQNIQNNNVNLWFAKDKNNKTILINEINENNKHEEYKCPICNCKVIGKTGNKNSWHFAHNEGNCSSETMIHWWVKNELIKQNEKFKIDIDGKIDTYKCKEIFIEKEFKTSYGIYKPDLTVETYDNNIIFFEIADTNRKSINNYIDIWEELGNIVVEINVKDIINYNNIEKYKSIYYKGKKYKEISKNIREISNIEKLKGNYSKEQLEKIDWLINDMCKYSEGLINIDELSYEIQLIEDEECKKLISDILKKNRCRFILNDYVNYNKSELKNINNMEYINEPRKIYDRIYGKYEFCMNICKNKFYYYESILNKKIIKKASKILNNIINDNSNNNYYDIGHYRLFLNQNISNIIDINNIININKKDIVNRILNNYFYLYTFEKIKYYEKITKDNIKDKIQETNENYNKYYKKKLKRKYIKKYICDNIKKYFGKIKIETTIDTIQILDINNNSIVYYYLWDNIDINNIINKIEKRLNFNKMLNLYKNYIYKINKKMEIVNRNPTVKLSEDINCIYLYVDIKCKNKEGNLYYKTISTLELKEDIGYEKLSDCISDVIRNYIYKLNKEIKYEY